MYNISLLFIVLLFSNYFTLSGRRGGYPDDDFINEIKNLKNDVLPGSGMSFRFLQYFSTSSSDLGCLVV